MNSLDPTGPAKQFGCYIEFKERVGEHTAHRMSNENAEPPSLQPATIKKGPLVFYFAMQLFEQSHLQFVSQLCVCVSWCTSKKSRGPIYISPRPFFMSKYPRAQLRCSGLLRLSMQPKSSLLLLGQERQVAVVYFDPFWQGLPSLSSHNFIIMTFFPENNRSPWL